MAVAQKVSMRSTVAARPASRSAVVVRASVESRRAVLSGFLAGAAALTLSGNAKAVNLMEIKDDRKVKEAVEVSYQARDQDLPISVRDGLAQARQKLEDVKKRAKASEAVLDSNVEPLVKKNYWILARDELRVELGTLRFDLNTLAEAKPKDEKKAALALKKDFIAKVEALDYALRTKNEASALDKLAAAQAALDKVLAAVL